MPGRIMAESFQDRLAAHRAEAEAIDEQTGRASALQRRSAFQAGKAAAADIIGRVAVFGSTYERNAATLATAARQQPPGLAGQVAAGDLSDAAQTARFEADCQIPAEQLAFAYRERLAAARAAHYERAGRADRDWHLERER